MSLAVELLGHADRKVTIERYMSGNEHANPLAAELLDSALPPRSTGDGSAIEP